MKISILIIFIYLFTFSLISCGNNEYSNDQNISAGTSPFADLAISKTHKGKKLNYICSINPCRIHTLTLDVSVLDGTTIKEADGSRFIAEFIIKPQAIKK